jgi:hypothetical protein
MIQSLVLMVSLTALASAQTLDPPPFQVMPQPGAVVDYYNQHSGTTLTGDTPAYTMWLPTGSFSYVPPGGAQIQVRGSVFGMYADGTDPASVNFAIVRLVKLDFANPKNTQIQLVNAMAGYGTNAARDVPKGWNGQYTAGAGNDANWKASNGWSMDGHLFLPVYRVRHDDYPL